MDATAHNLDRLSVKIPKGGIVAITGVSGSGKSTLVKDVIYQSWLTSSAHGCEKITGLETFEKVVSVDQKRHFVNSRGTPVTYTGIFDLVRNLFAHSPDAKKLELKRSHFSFLSASGGCERCNGSGVNKISMDFMADVKMY